MIDKDIEEAKKHLDFTNDFPFLSHDTPENDLKSIWESVSEDRMPPLKYRMLHWDSKLTNDEKKIIKKWVSESLEKIK